jgi:hypothetical protein
MFDHVLTMYELKNASNLTLEYRLYSIDGFLGAGRGDEDLVDRNINLLAKLVAIRERTPVAIVRRGNVHFLALPADRTLHQLEYPVTPAVVRLVPDQTTHSFHLPGTSEEHRRIAMKFIEFSLRNPLNRNGELWEYVARTFLQKRPVNFRETDRAVDLYEGFQFSLRFYENRFFLGVNLTYKYIDSAWLADRFSVDQMRSLKMRHVLYHFGNRWYVVQMLDLLGVAIKDARFQPDGTNQITNVFDYTQMENKNNAPPWIQALDPGSPAITYRSPGRDKIRFGAAALGKLVHRTDAPEVRSLHRKSIKQPGDRFRFTSQIVERYFASATLGGVDLGIAIQPWQVAAKMFQVPAIEFGQGRTLRVGGQPSSESVRLSEFPSTRMSKLLDPQCGFAVTSPMDAQYLLIPQSLPRDLANDFKGVIEGAVRGFIHTPYRLEPVLYDDRQARTLKQQVDSIVGALTTAKVTHGHGLLILPAQAKPDLHNYVKSTLKDTIQFQCVSAAKLRDFYRTVLRDGRGVNEVPADLRGRYTSYLRYTALGLLIVNRQWGWVLKDPTHYDAYISFDVLGNHAAFAFFYKGGRVCVIRTFPSRRKEKLLRVQVREIVYEALKQDLARGVKVRSIVLQRDGRLFESEWSGFSEAISRLVQEGLVPADVLTGATEVHKKSANAVRIADTGPQGLRNPRIGVALQMAEKEGFVCNTGFPFKLNGSVNPLQVRVVKGDLDLPRILEDVFRKSLLSWPVPDRMIRLPIDLKLCDEFLRAFAADADEDEAEYGEEQDLIANAASAG